MTTHNPKFRGTPGPWRVDGHEHKNGVVEYTIVSISGDAVGCAPVAEVLRNNPRPMPEQRIEANARLLAAAPDLLAVLEIIVGIFEPNKLTPYRSARETVDLAKQIIGYVYGADERNRPTNESPSNDAEFLEWLYVRLVGTHGENPKRDRPLAPPYPLCRGNPGRGYTNDARPAARTGRSNHRICRPLQIERAEKRVSDTCRRAAQTHANRRT